MAAVLWAGGEDIDFPNGTLPLTVSSSYYRSGYARCSIYQGNTSNTTSASTLSFSGGAVTTCWLHAQGHVAAPSASKQFIGLGLNSAAQVAIAIGSSGSSPSQTALWKYSGGAWTQLAAETGNSLPASSIFAIDVNVQNFGSAATVYVYINGTLVITYAGSTAVTGVSNLDCVCLIGNGVEFNCSEIIVTDTLDTRAMSVLTAAPNAAGDTNNWTGTYTNINPTTINDSSVISVDTTGADFQANVIDLPAGTFSVPAVKVSARAEVTSGAVPTGIKLGVRISSVNYLDTAHTLTNAFAPYERLMTTNPATSAAWAQSDIDPLQLALESA